MTPGGSNVLEYDIRSKRKLPELHMSWNLALKSALVQDAVVFARTLLLLP